MATNHIDINTATVEDFEKLFGVGRSKAEAVVRHRKVVGGFTSISDLNRVPGVGQSVLDLNRGRLTCSQSKRASRARLGRGRSERASSRTEPLLPTSRKRNVAQKAKTSCVPSTSKENTDSVRNDNAEEKEKAKGSVSGPSVSLMDVSENGGNETDDDEGDRETGRDSDTEDMDDTGEDGDRLSVVSESLSSSSLYRSRIPIPIAGSFGKHLMKRKSNCRREDFLLPPGKRLCYSEYSSPQTTYSNLRAPQRHGVLLHRQRIPSKDNPPTGLAEWLQKFKAWGNAERLMALDELITYCEPTQVRHMMQVIEPQFQRDFISLLPKELALYVLSFLGPKDLLQAAQTCRYWRVLTEDNLLWREKCKEETIDESLVFGTNRLRRRQPSPKSPWKSLYMRQHQIEQNWRSGAIRTPKALKGHDDHVITCLEFYGTRIVSGSDDNTLKVWSAITGKCLRTLVGHTGGVWSSQMHANTIISGSTDRTLKVWNADSGQCIHTLYGHTSTVRCMHLYGSKVVSGSRDATLRVWNVETGQCLHVLMGHVAAVRCVQYDGRRVVSGAYDYMVKVWDPETETCLHTLQGHTNRVYSLQFDGNHIVSGSLDTSIRVWDVETGNCLHTLVGHQSLTSGLELKDNILVSGNADSTVKVWDITTGQCLQTLQGSNKHQSAVTCLQFNKKFVITSSDDGTVKIWCLKTGEFLRNLVSLDSGGSGGVVWRVRCSNTKLVCAVGSRNGTEETKLLVLDFDVEEKRDSKNLIEKT